VPAKLHRAATNPLSNTTLVLRASTLVAIPWLVHGFSTRLGGVSAIPDLDGSHAELNLGKGTWDSTANVETNRRRLLECLRADGLRLHLQQQIHSDLIRVLDHIPAPGSNPRGDGLITDRKGMLLGILSADCLPIFVVDVRQKVVAAFHCGWRGTARRIAQKGVGRMRLLFGSRPEDLRAAIGPGIRDCCYRVGEEVAAEYETQFLYASSLLVIQKSTKRFVDKSYALMRNEPWRGTPSPDGRIIHLDLVKANVRQLEEAGLGRAQIHADVPCTSCHPELFFSHRRDAGRTGRMLSVIGIRH
jgi:purine-nucleoside/S-methyl-5'-thioadenosine phosphorylase / adenosine deaminase